MISRPLLRLLAPPVLVALALFAALPARAYDPPDFEAGLFSRDGVFLAEDERTSLLEALAALASNFPDHARVDEDLRERALALALRLDPLHEASRIAHRELSIGSTPKPTGSFDSLSTVSETLWTIGKRLTEPPLDPEEKRLAPYLLELSLLTHPEPTEDRLVEFARVAGDDPPNWEATARLQRDGSVSTARARDLFRAGQELARERRRPAMASADGSSPTGVSSQPVPGPGIPPNPNRPPRPAQVEIEPVTVSLVTVRQVASIESVPVAGTVSLVIREPRGGLEREFLDARVGASSPFALYPSDEAIPLDPLDVPALAATGRSWTWPEGAIGEVRFEAASPPPGPRRLLRTSALLPALALMESALAKKPVNDAFVLLGGIDPANAQAVLLGDPVATIEVAVSLKRPYLLIPATALDPLLADIQRSGRLDLLFESELIAYTDAAGAIDRLTSPTDPALVAASADFAKIKSASATMPLPELARLPSAQDRLRALLAGFPAHLSARAMLEFGVRPVTAEIRLSQFGSKVDDLVGPFLALESDDADLDALSGIVGEAGPHFSSLGREAPLEARDLLGAAEDLVDAAELYLEIQNKGTSNSDQRLRETREAIVDYVTEREKLGLGSPGN